jgi:hypothetical protein
VVVEGSLEEGKASEKTIRVEEGLVRGKKMKSMDDRKETVLLLLGITVIGLNLMKNSP